MYEFERRGAKLNTCVFVNVIQVLFFQIMSGSYFRSPYAAIEIILA